MKDEEQPPDPFAGWTWDKHGVRVNRRWWVAMADAPLPGSFAPPVPRVTGLLKRCLSGCDERVPLPVTGGG